MNKIQNKTTPIFIVGSGRSGTRMMFRLFSGISNVEAYHEYCCTHIQPQACLYYMNKISKKEMLTVLSSIYKSAIYFSDADFFIDASNKLSWVIPELFELFPNAKFINLVRDGRKVTSSFFHKLNSEIYDDISVKALTKWLYNPKSVPMPPPEKKYWWNIPQEGQFCYKEFSSFNQFERIVYHWTEVNRVIEEAFTRIPKDQQTTIKIEELVSDEKKIKELFSFIKISYSHNYFSLLEKPQGVIFPMDFSLTREQKIQFNRIARNQMKRLGYAETKEYHVSY